MFFTRLKALLDYISSKRRKVKLFMKSFKPCQKYSAGNLLPFGLIYYNLNEEKQFNFPAQISQ